MASRPSSANTIDGILRRSAARHPDRTALVFDDRSFTYRQLDDAVSAAAAGLVARGLQQGDRVAAYGTNSDAYVIGFLACCRAGLVHVPINYALRGEELRYLVVQSGARAVLVDPALSERIDEIRGDLAEVEEIVPVGSLDPDTIHTPGIFVHRIIQGPHEKRIEQRTLRTA